MKRFGNLNVCSLLLTLSMLCFIARSQLRTDFYSPSCPNVFKIVRREVQRAMMNEMRIAASLLRLQFHDCFVNGCDGSIFLDGDDSEKLAFPNRNSARGFEVVDTIKSAVESACSGIVSCADILTIATRDSVLLSGGPNWKVLLGRRDGMVANQSGANSNLAGPTETIQSILTKFASVGLNLTDVVSLSGAHTIGSSRCGVFNTRFFNFSGSGAPDSRIEDSMLSDIQNTCPTDGDGNKTVPLDRNSVDLFDNQYYKNLLNGQGLFASDQSLATGNETLTATTRTIVELYSNQNQRFLDDFVKSMIKMANISPLTGTDGEIRKNCRTVNS
ncbi:peroxidase N [Apium graveolens]|uniref:peroxidase N n=1 Tax=Apium graveolens TaxID=4045 RepID=UPI003D78B911